MAKVHIKNLPDGCEFVDGKVKKVQVKKSGGYVTGDQADYGLVTTPQEYYGSTNFNNSLDSDVRYSLTSVPREDANVEAEGGETVLADLNSDGQFGLYDINGGGEIAAKADMEWYHKAGQLTGDFGDLDINDFWYLKPLQDAN